MERNENLRIVEINGVKIEVDLRTAKRIDCFKVGDAVKVLVKPSYSNSYESKLGMIVGFDEFKNLPTIIVATLSYDGSIEIKAINAETKDLEIAPLTEFTFGWSKSDMLKKFDREIAQKEQELLEKQQKKEVFLSQFGRFFEKTGEV